MARKINITYDTSNIIKNNKTFDWINESNIGNEIKFNININNNTFNGILKIINIKMLECNYIKYAYDVMYKDKILEDIPVSIFKMNICPLCIKKIFENELFLYDIGDIIKRDNFNITVLDRRINKKTGIKQYKILCNHCGFNSSKHYIVNKKKYYDEYWIDEKSLSTIRECPCCGNHSHILVKGINDLWTTHPEIAMLLENPEDGYKYTAGSTVKVNFKCPYCNKIHNKSIAKVTSRGFKCSVCGDGIPIGEKILYNFLSQYTNDVEKEKVFSWALDKRYDFYSKNLDIICEVFGAQHYKDEFSRINTTKRKGRSYKDEHINDIKKAKLALSNGYKNRYIIINTSSADFKIIKENIIKSKLSLYVDMSQCDWNMVFRKSIKSKMIEVCELYNSGIVTTSELAKLSNISPSTVVKYLKKCAEINLCDYTPTHYNKEAIKKANKAVMKKVICLQTMEIFDSMANAERHYNLKQSLHPYCNGVKKMLFIPNIGKTQWVYYDEYLLLSDYEISKILEYGKQVHTREIICLQTKKIYYNASEAARDIGLKSGQCITKCCKKQQSYTKSKEGIKIQWMFLDEYNNLSDEKINNIMYNNSILSEKINKTKNNKKKGESLRKKIYVYDIHNNFISSYCSLSDLCDRSLDDFGVVFLLSHVSMVCNGKKKSYKGYIFSYKPLDEENISQYIAVRTA